MDVRSSDDACLKVACGGAAPVYVKMEVEKGSMRMSFRKTRTLAGPQKIAGAMIMDHVRTCGTCCISQKRERLGKPDLQTSCTGGATPVDNEIALQPVLR